MVIAIGIRNMSDIDIEELLHIWAETPLADPPRSSYSRERQTALTLIERHPGECWGLSYVLQVLWHALDRGRDMARRLHGDQA